MSPLIERGKSGAGSIDRSPALSDNNVPPAHIAGSVTRSAGDCIIAWWLRPRRNPTK
ncbi:MAG: hypothetical protein K2L14_08560 [Duncaniella sp.]|nr:hypothetical protein [Duncaniella sp.]